MKQLATFVAAGFMALSLTACGGEDQQRRHEGTHEATPQATQVPAQDAHQHTPNQVNDNVETGSHQGVQDNQMQE